MVVKGEKRGTRVPLVAQWSRCPPHVSGSLLNRTRDRDGPAPTEGSAIATVGVGPTGADGTSSVSDTPSGDPSMAEEAGSSGSKV